MAELPSAADFEIEQGDTSASGSAIEGNEVASRLDRMLADLEGLVDEIAARPNLGGHSAPVDDIATLASIGLLTAALPRRFGGCGLGIEPGGHLPLLRVLALIGGADLVLGRLYEGHVNALILVGTYGTEVQLERAAQNALSGMLFGVWNTGEAKALRLEALGDRFVFAGGKTFASGAAFVRRPIVTAELPDRGWQMTLPRMESPAVVRGVTIDRGFWSPLGMEASESFGIDFTGASIHQDDLIGSAGDFYRDPLFRGGAIRFAAVHAGAVIRLHRLFAAWLQDKGRANDPYQIARLGEIAIEAQSAVLWIERAAAVAEECFAVDADKLATERMVDCANTTRVAIEKIGTSVLQKVVAGVGAHGLLRPNPFEKIVRDLTMYLRQPAPDHALAEVGRIAIRKNNLRAAGAENYMWRNYQKEGSLPPRYFEDIYRRSRDPWNFETSEYEEAKYRNTLALLPRARYRCALEVGSSIGVFTQQLAERCDELISVDVSEKALQAARKRCEQQENVHFVRAQIPMEIPDGRYQLIVVSEVAYYWSRERLELGATLMAQHQEAGDHLALVHLITPVPDYPLTGDEVHDAWLMRPEWRLLNQERYERYRIDILERTDD